MPRNYILGDTMQNENAVTGQQFVEWEASIGLLVLGVLC